MLNMRGVVMPRFPVAPFGAAVLVASAIGTASAADLPGPAPMPPPTAPAVYVPTGPAFSWTGFYIGANAGYGWSSGSGTATVTGPAGTDAFSASGNGFVGGGQAGFNYQFDGAVIGLETDFQGTSGSGPFTATGAAPITATAKDPWFGTVRGRLGYSFDRFMIYATGGGVYGDATANGRSGGTAFSTSATYLTWTAGLGIEYAFWGRVSGKVEYLYAGSPSSLPPIPRISSVSGSADNNLVRAGLNYHF
jgi:outer membrane immunogenic protein